MEHADLPASLRKVLERAIREARIAAEAGASDAIRRLAVAAASPPSHLDKLAKDLRVRLRAHARSLGDTRRSDDTHEVGQLTEEVAYAHWHRLLFARFLLERRLLCEPESGGEVSLDDCRELARAQDLPDAWAAAERFAAAMLPGVFRPDDAALAITFAPEHAAALQRIVQSIDPATFRANDSLGWTYQFWRAAEKDAVNRAGEKIGAKSLPAVTQLFTEPYMVRFLLHNTLGAWWAGKVLAADPSIAQNCDDEAALRIACALPGIDWEYLRFIKEGGVWRPAAGTFSNWPAATKAVTVMDPCCGSGHFLVEAFGILTALRMKEEKLTPGAAAGAVLRDNIFGLELDGRCVQIASFAIALAAWRLGGRATVLPNPHIAWVGAPPPLPKAEFVALANGNAELAHALGALHDLFVRAPLLGSLIDPIGSDLVDPLRIARIEEMLEPLIEKARSTEPERAEGTVAARGMADALAILVRHYTLQATNVPFLGRGNQADALSDYFARVFPNARADLATVMLERMTALMARHGSLTAVTPQNWLFLTSYKDLRRDFLGQLSLNGIAGLGSGAFETIGGEVVNVALIILSAEAPGTSSTFFALDSNHLKDHRDKTKNLKQATPLILTQRQQTTNPDARITLQPAASGDLLSKYANCFVGFQNGDTPCWVRCFWEVPAFGQEWALFQNTSEVTVEFAGRNSILKWENGKGELARSEQARVQGREAWDQSGVIVRQNYPFPVGLYTGDLYDQSCSVIIPKDEKDLPAIWTFCSSEKFEASLRAIDKKRNVTTATMIKVAFDANHWRREAAAKFPKGLPEPYSQDPTQWLFHGHPVRAASGTALHVAIARLAGYRWPVEFDPKMRLAPEARSWIAKAARLPGGAADGLLCLPAVAGDRSLADRLRSFLASALGADWSDATERRLLAETDENFEKKSPRDSSMDGWLRDRAFRQHCALFHQRPFLWHIWDGQKDGFAAIVNYHCLNRANLEKLTFSLLGDWIGRMKAAADGRRVEAATILQQRLQAILEGEKPYDIFARWKPLTEQPLGWDADLDDGVRMNIRPFVEAEVLRDVPNIKWTKDRGTDPSGAPWYLLFRGDRINDHHTTLAEKRRARGLK